MLCISQGHDHHRHLDFHLNTDYIRTYPISRMITDRFRT